MVLWSSPAVASPSPGHNIQSNRKHFDKGSKRRPTCSYCHRLIIPVSAGCAAEPARVHRFPVHRSSWTVVNRFALSFIRLIHHVVIDQNQLRPSNESHNGAHLSFGFVSIPQMVNCRRLSLVRVAVSSLMSVFIQHRAVWVRDLFSIARTGGWAAPEKSQKKEGPTLAKLLARDLEPFHKKNTQLASHSLAGGRTRRPIFNQRPRLVGCCANHWASSNPIFQRTHQMLAFLTKINKRLSFFETSRSSTSRREPSLGRPTKNTKNFQRNM